uniref:DNA-dependent RNA polymerase n=1 Tax=uncultured marine virus TaxID=186617 RepID=A0A0F7L886_9VIRU|nr:DNA-dependent RNA polymerase [uncultured marine virus]
MKTLEPISYGKTHLSRGLSWLFVLSTQDIRRRDMDLLLTYLVGWMQVVTAFKYYRCC